MLVNVITACYDNFFSFLLFIPQNLQLNISVSDPSYFDDPHLEKWIRIRVPIFHIFHKELMSDKLKCLFLLPPKFRKGISQITKTFSFTYYSK